MRDEARGTRRAGSWGIPAVLGCLVGMLVFGLPHLPAQAQETPARQIVFGASYTEGSTRVVPVMIDQLDGVLAGDLDLTYDSAQVTAIRARATNLLAGFLFISNPVSDTLKIAFASASAILDGGGVLLEVVVEPADAEPALAFAMVSLNDGQIAVTFEPATAVGASRSLGQLKRRVRDGQNR